MNKTLKFILFVCGIALFVHGVSLILPNAPSNIKSYLIIGLGASIACLGTMNVKS